MLTRSLRLIAISTTLVALTAAARSNPSTAPARNAAVNAKSTCHEWIDLHGPQGVKKGRLCHINVENMESIESSGAPHAPIGLSVGNNESVLLTSTANDFRLNKLVLIDPNSKNSAGQPCPKHPFKRKFNAEDQDADESTQRVFDNMHLTGVAKKSAIGCQYEMKIKHQNGAVSDPHLRIDK